MLKFIRNILYFISPVLLLFILNEYYCRTQTTFGIKKKYLVENIDSIEVLILGSSISQCALNPNYIENKSSNLAFGGQPISIDYFLLKKYIDQMESLKTVIFEVSPFRFYNDHEINEWNSYIYSNLYNINYKTNPFSIKNYSLIISDFNYFTSIFINYINPFNYKYKINEFGFITNDFNDKFERLKYDSTTINKTFEMPEIWTNDEDIFKLNATLLKKIILECESKNVNLILISPPIYQTYNSKIPDNAKEQVNNLINDYKREFGLTFLDYSQDTTFNIYDFKNDNHLNPDGAKKLTKKIERLIDKNIKVD